VYSVRIRRLSERARLEGMLALRRALDGVRRGQGVAPAASDDVARASAPSRDNDASRWLVRAETTRAERAVDEPTSASSGERGLELGKAFDRIATSIERLGAQLDSYHHERAEHLEAIEFLLRELVISTVQPAPAPSVVLGGVVDAIELDPDEGITIIPDAYPLDVDTAVEVRSRFHDRWISGFSIAESVDTSGRCRYRLTRRSDGIPLPILFEACDVRAASTAGDRKYDPASRLSRSETPPRP
jgi:hypothetical protein